MSLLNKIITPAASPEKIAEIIKPADKSISGGETVSTAPVDNGQAENPPEKPALEFTPIPDEIIPPLQNVAATAAAIPPISEESPNPPGEPVRPMAADGTNGGADLPPGGDEPGNSESVKRGRGRPPGSKTSRPPELLTSGADPEKQLEAVAGMTFDMSTGALALILGEEWQPKSKAERDFVVTAIANYYRATGTVDLPPGWTLAFVISAYSLPRMTEPKTKEKLTATWYWIKTKVAGVFKRKGK